MVPESIMKIFLMIAVIIVGMSFLLKAFGIDIFGWLQEKFAGLGLTEARALYVKLDTGKTKTILNFELTNTKLFLVDDEAGGIENYKTFFYISNFPSGKCTILTAKRDLGGWDDGGIYYVLPGTVLDSTCNSIKDCITTTADPKWNLCDFRETTMKAPEGKQCANKCKKVIYDTNKKSYEIVEDKCEGDYSYVDCDPSGGHISDYRQSLQYGRTVFCDYDRSRTYSGSLDKDGKVINQDFNIEFKWECGNKCRLLDLDELDKKANKLSRIRVKFGLICDENGVWKMCKNLGDLAESKDPTTREDKTYKCETESGMYVWKPQ